MYIRKSTRSYRDKTYVNHLLVESVQTPKGPRQRTVCSLGDLSPRPRKEWLKLACKVEDALVGQGDLLDPVADRDRECRKWAGKRALPLGAVSALSPTSGFGETKLFCIRRIGVLVVTMAVASTSARA